VASAAGDFYFYTMLLLSAIRNDAAGIVQDLAKRNLDAQPIVDRILELNASRRSIQVEAEAAQAEANQIAKKIGQLFKSGKGDQANALKEDTKALKLRIQDLGRELEAIEAQEKDALISLPNRPDELVPAGNSESDNITVSTWGTKPELTANKPHWDLTEIYGLIDFERGVKIAGAGFPVYTGKGARLQRALIQWFLDQNAEAGYTEVIPPFFVNEASAYGTGQLPDKEGQMYHMPVDNLYAIPTAEIPVTNMLRDEILSSEDLPVKYTAHSPCFRREAGSYGKDVRGLNRLHQFEKVEIVCVDKPEKSAAHLDGMVSHVGSLLESLGLHYRVLRLCGGDLGFAASITYDFEVWSAAQERWLEVSSVSNFKTFQSSRLKLRYREDAQSKPTLCHTLNGSSLALPRVLAALLENNQDATGIDIPDVLHQYTGFTRIQ
jgi:seryl-tRNA synthetase